MSGRARDCSVGRRRFLKQVTTAATGTVLVGSAGCLSLLGLDGGGTAGIGGGPTFQDIHREDADVIVESAAALKSEVNRGGDRIVWVPSDAQIDMTGRNITVRNATIASGRSDEGSGALIVTTNRGRGSPAMDNAVFTLEEGSRLTGVTIRGPHWNYTNSPVIPGYIPMAPGATYAAREEWRGDWYARAVSVQADSSQVDNCEIWGFSTALMVGTRGQAVSPTILYCHLHNCMMTSAGYLIDVKRGMPTIYRCSFDAYRHALNGYGTADAGYLAIECTFGPHASSHPIDMHGIHNNAPDGGSSNPDDLRYRWRAGGTMLVRNCTILPTSTVGQRHHNGVNAGTHAPNPYVNHNRGGFTPHAHIRAVPADGFYFEGNACAHPDPETAIEQSSIPGRYSTNALGWHNIFTQQNQWGINVGGGDGA